MESCHPQQARQLSFKNSDVTTNIKAEGGVHQSIHACAVLSASMISPKQVMMGDLGFTVREQAHDLLLQHQACSGGGAHPHIHFKPVARP